MYALDQIKHAAAKEKKLEGMTVNESVVYNTYVYCYRTYKANPTEETKRRLAEFVKPTVERCMGKAEQCQEQN